MSNFSSASAFDQWQLFLKNVQKVATPEICSILSNSTFLGLHSTRRKVLIRLNPRDFILQDKVGFSNVLWQQSLIECFPGFGDFLFVGTPVISPYGLSEEEYQLLNPSNNVNLTKKNQSLWDIFLSRIVDCPDPLAMDVVRRASYLSCDIPSKEVYVVPSPRDVGHNPIHAALSRKRLWSPHLASVFDGCGKLIFVTDQFTYAAERSLTFEQYNNKFSGGGGKKSDRDLWKEIRAELGDTLREILESCTFVVLYNDTIYLRDPFSGKSDKRRFDPAKEVEKRRGEIRRSTLEQIGREIEISFGNVPEDAVQYPPRDIENNRSFSYWFIKDIQKVLNEIKRDVPLRDYKVKDDEHQTKEELDVQVRREFGEYSLARHETPIARKIIKALNLSPRGQAQLAAYDDKIAELVLEQLKEGDPYFLNSYFFFLKCNQIYEASGRRPNRYLIDRIISFEGINKSSSWSESSKSTRFISKEDVSKKRNDYISYVNGRESYWRHRARRLEQEELMFTSNVEKLTNQIKGCVKGALFYLINWNDVVKELLNFFGKSISFPEAVLAISSTATKEKEFVRVARLLAGLITELNAGPGKDASGKSGFKMASEVVLELSKQQKDMKYEQR